MKCEGGNERMRKQSMMGSSRYEYNSNQLDLDIANTKRKSNMFKHELETAIDMCYQRHVNNFRQYETAIDILKETLREKFVEYGEKL